MSAVIKKTALVGLGTLALAKKAIGATIEKLYEEGKASQGRGKKFVKGVVEGLSKRTKGLKLKARVDTAIDSLLVSAHIPTKKDFQKLNRKLENLASKPAKRKGTK